MRACSRLSTKDGNLSPSSVERSIKTAALSERASELSRLNGSEVPSED